MTRIQVWFSLASAWIALLCCLLSHVAPEERRQTPVGEVSEFQRRITRLCASERITILCEEQPFRVSLRPADSAELDQRLAQATTSAEKVSALAAAFDYSVEAPQANVFSLLKRFTDTNDLPFYSLPEVAERIRRLHTICEQFLPPSYTEHLFRKLVDGFTEAQWREMEENADGIAFRSLRPEQQVILRRELLRVGWRDMSAVLYLDERFAGCLRPPARFEYLTTKGISGPSYTYPGRGLPGEKRVLLGYQTYSTVSYGMAYLNSVPPPSAQTSGGGATDSTDPVSLPDPYLASPPLVRISTTLDSLIREIPRLAKWKTSPYRALLCDALITERRLLVAGLENAPIDALLSALATVCDARIVRTSAKPDTVRIAVPNREPVHEAKELRWAIRQMLPSSLHRLLAAHSRRIAKSLEEQPKPGPREFSLQAKQLAEQNDGPWQQMYLISMRRLRNLVEKEWEARREQRLPMAEASAQMRSLVVLSSLATAIPELKTIMETSPNPVFVRTEQIQIRIQRTDRPNSFIYKYVHRDPETGRQSGIGGSRANP